MKYLKVLLFGIFAGLAIGLGSFAFTITKYLLPGTPGAIFASALFSIAYLLALRMASCSSVRTFRVLME